MLRPVPRPDRSCRLTFGGLDEVAACKEEDRIGEESLGFSGKTTDNILLDYLANKSEHTE
jgi:hypothetical protein